MITNVHDNSRAQLDTAYFVETGRKSSKSAEPMTSEETIAFLSQPVRKIQHPVLQSTLYDPRLEERIL